MSCYHITLHPTTGAKTMRAITNEAQYLALRASDRNRYHLALARKGDPTAKHRLVQFNYSCLPNPDGTLRGATVLSTSFGMDIDFDPASPVYQQLIDQVPQLILAKRDEVGLLLLERSASKGYHAVFRRRPGLSQEENLRWASAQLGVTFDAAAKDHTRVFFTTSAEPSDLLFIHPDLFDNSPAPSLSSPSSLAPASQPSPSLSSPTSAPASQPSAPPSRSNAPSPTSAPASQPSSPASPAPDYHGIPYPAIVATYWRLHHGGQQPHAGDRNSKTFELALALAPICDYSQPWLESVVPIYDGLPADEWRMCIQNALKEPRRGIGYRLRKVLQELRPAASASALPLVGVSAPLPALPAQLPPLIELLTSRVPAIYKPAVAEAVWPALGAHLHGVKFRYIDGVDHEATFMSVLMAPMSIGKSCINAPIERIMADIAASDDEARRRDQAWKDANRRKGANKDKAPRPTDICIQMLMSDLTNAALVQRLIDAQANGERYLYSNLSEIELLNQVKASGKGDTVGQLIRLAFDNSVYGQERVSQDAVSGTAPVRWNWNASATIEKGRQFLLPMVNDGTLSRLSISTIVKPDGDNTMPRYGQYDEQFDAALRPFIDRLNAASGRIECPDISAFIEEMISDNADEAADLRSEAYRVLSYRATVIGFLKAMVLYITHDHTWTPVMADYVRWSIRYNLACMMKFFGTDLDADIEQEKRFRNTGPRSILSYLPDPFTLDDYLTIRKQQGLPAPADPQATLRKWVQRKKITFDDLTNQWHKL